jgi:hypothetical protein
MKQSRFWFVYLFYSLVLYICILLFPQLVLSLKRGIKHTGERLKIQIQGLRSHGFYCEIEHSGPACTAVK